MLDPHSLAGALEIDFIIWRTVRQSFRRRASFTLERNSLTLLDVGLVLSSAMAVSRGRTAVKPGPAFLQFLAPASGLDHNPLRVPKNHATLNSLAWPGGWIPHTGRENKKSPGMIRCPGP